MATVSLVNNFRAETSQVHGGDERGPVITYNWDVKPLKHLPMSTVQRISS